MKKTLVALVLLVPALFANPLEAASITLTGVTTGCFGTCPPGVFADQVNSGTGLWFNGDAFSLQIFDDGTFIQSGSLGLLSRTTADVTVTTFNLRLDFADVFGASPDQQAYLAHVTYNGPNARFDFPPPPGPGAVNYTFSSVWGTGTFTIQILDVANLTNGGTAQLLALITNATFVPAPDVTAVPEPGSLFLLGIGLVAAAAGARRRLRS